MQAGTLKNMFPDGAIKRFREESLTWTCSVTPSSLSSTYELKLHYIRNNGVKVYVIDPKPLALANGKKHLPHVYSTPEQRLCLYYPNGVEWNVGMLYTKTIIPWACEWLCHYELWVCTGIWHGGGIQHETEVEKQANKQKEKNDEPNSNKKQIGQ
ncbi:MAG: hypothetical protein J5I50_05975 [Chitinophagaceae bacterium]|nr:hypothetical protein [Chitinophagaceae bacterium]